MNKSCLTPLIGAMSISDGYGHQCGRNGQFCIGPVSGNATILI